MNSKNTLNDVLVHLGFTKACPLDTLNIYQYTICKDGLGLFDGTASDVWDWLRENNYINW